MLFKTNPMLHKCIWTQCIFTHRHSIKCGPIFYLPSVHYLSSHQAGFIALGPSLTAWKSHTPLTGLPMSSFAPAPQPCPSPLAASFGSDQQLCAMIKNGTRIPTCVRIITAFVAHQIWPLQTRPDQTVVKLLIIMREERIVDDLENGKEKDKRRAWKTEKI